MMEKVKFNGQRLREAVQFRGKKMAELARETGISRQSLSLYANGENMPSFENVLKIAKNLEFPVGYFLSEDKCITETNNTYFRSQSAAKKVEQNAQKIRLEYAVKLYKVLLNYVDFPPLDLGVPTGLFLDSTTLSALDARVVQEKIEQLTISLREAWGVGLGPIGNLQFLLESHGIIVTGFHNVEDTIDAFSQRVQTKAGNPVYIVALALGSKPKERLRFDMAHELGHILMHNWDEDNEVLDREEFNAIESQANMFASALLLPRKTFGQSVRPYATNLEFYRALKNIWGVSMQAMMYRARQLGIISTNQFQYLMRQVSRKGWRLHEPGDRPGTLNATIFQGAVDVLFEGEYLTPESLLEAFRDAGIYLKQKDLEELMGLLPGTLNINTRVIPLKTKIEIKR